MNNLRMVKLGDIVSITPTSVTPDKTMADLPHVGSDSISSWTGTINGWRTIEEDNAVSSKYIFDTGDILYSKIRPYLNKVAIVNFGGLCSTEILPIKLKDSNFYDHYIYHLLKSPKFLQYAKAHSSGANIPRINKAKILEFSFWAPCLLEQKKIAFILNKIQSIQEMRERQLITFDRLKHSLLQETIKSSIIQEIPVGKVISLKNGSFLPAKKQDGGKFPVYGGNGVNGSHSQYMVEEPTIIIGRVGAYCGSVHITRPKSWVTDNALIVTIQTEGILQKYLAHVLHSINLNQYANRSGQPSISATRIKDITIPIVPLTEQEKFTKNINNIDRQIYLIRKSLEEDKALFVSLQSVLFDN